LHGCGSTELLITNCLYLVKPSLALSTSWNSFRHADGYAMLREIADLGFSHAELSHGIRVLLVPGILRAVEEGVIKISSVHNFCPLPTGYTQSAPNLYEPSVSEHREQVQWLRHTKRSIDFAAQVKAKVCVLHLGSVRFWLFPPSMKLKSFLRNNVDVSAPNDLKYRILLRKMCVRLREKMPDAWRQVFTSLGRINNYALERRVALGCENREKFEELPVDDDFPAMFETLGPGSAYGYWHDTGHAEIKRAMGMVNHHDLIARNASKLLGFHLHDVDPRGKDHQAIGSGGIDFTMISSFWQPHHLLTLELSPRLTLEEVMSSKTKIEALIDKRFG
jgi:sugar phosphate isomerase/epimerase